jgi:hypothetical protein
MSGGNSAGNMNAKRNQKSLTRTSEVSPLGATFATGGTSKPITTKAVIRMRNISAFDIRFAI